MTPTAPHYGDPCSAIGCRSDEHISTLRTGGKFCTSYCNDTSSSTDCPTDVPAGVTAVPLCLPAEGVEDDDTASKSECVLGCSYTAAIKDQKVADAQCGGSGATCDGFLPSICAYDWVHNDGCSPTPSPPPPPSFMCDIGFNAFECPLPDWIASHCSAVHSCASFPQPPAFPTLAVGGSAAVVGGSMAAGSALAALPAISHPLHVMAAGLLFQGQVVGMLGQLNVGWAPRMNSTQGVLQLFNFQFKGVAAAAAKHAPGGGGGGGGRSPAPTPSGGSSSSSSSSSSILSARRRLSISSTAADLGLSASQMFPVLLLEILLIGLLVSLIWGAVWQLRKRHMPEAVPQQPAAAADDDGHRLLDGDASQNSSAGATAAAAAASVHEAGRGTRVLKLARKRSRVASALYAVKLAAKGASSAAKEDYRGGMDTSHWSGLTLSCWFLDKVRSRRLLATDECFLRSLLRS